MKKLFITFLCIAGVFCFSSCDISGLLSYLEEQQEQNQGDDDDQGGSDISPTISKSEMNEKGYAIKLAYTDLVGNNDGFIVYTRKGKKYRWDTVKKDNVYAYWYDSDTEEGYRYYEWKGEYSEPGEWEDYEYYRCQQTVTNLFAEWVNDGSSLLKNYGFSKTGETTILGLPCDVWSGTYSAEGKSFGASVYGEMVKEGAKGEFCVWNGLTLRTTVNDKVQTECTAIVVGLDDSPFEKTEEITWIK